MIHMKHISTINIRKHGGTSIWIYLFFVVAGVAVGSWAAVRYDAAELVYINQCFLPSGGTQIPALVLGDIAFAAVFCFAAFFFGLCAVGQPFGIALLIYRGIGIGAAAAAAYLSMGAGAFVTVIFALMPKAAAFAFLAALAVRETVSYSATLFRCGLRKEENYVEKYSFRLYCIRFIVVMLLSLIISFADGAVWFIYNSAERG